MRRARSALLLALVAGFAGGAPSAAAPSPPLTVTDPTGDAIDGRASMDIASVVLEMRNIRASDPRPALVVTMKLTAPPEKQAVAYALTAQIPGCGVFNAYFNPGAVLNAHNGTPPGSVLVCNGRDDPTDDSEIVEVPTAVRGNTVTWTIAPDSLPKAARTIGRLVGIGGYTSIADPVTGIFDGDLTADVAGAYSDSVSSDKQFAFA